MTEALRRWADDNYLAIEEKRDDELNIIAIEGVGDFLYLHLILAVNALIVTRHIIPRR
jgi:hypothetical protein